MSDAKPDEWWLTVVCDGCDAILGVMKAPDGVRFQAKAGVHFDTKCTGCGYTGHYPAESAVRRLMPVAP